MDLISGFKSELFRPLAILVVPGTFATAPYVLLLARHNPEIGLFLDSNGLGFFGIFLVVATAAGMVVENLGSRIERGIDACINDRYLRNHWEEWGRYLELKTDSEVVGNRYLRTIVVRAKFAFSFIPALISFGVGLCLLQYDRPIWTQSSVWILVAILLVLISVLYIEGVRLSEVMAEARCRVLAAHGRNCVGSEDELKWPGMRVFVAYSLLNFVGRHPAKAAEIAVRWFPLPSVETKTMPPVRRRRRRPRRVWTMARR